MKINIDNIIILIERIIEEKNVEIYSRLKTKTLN